jgi:hypothetical protein
MDAVLTAYLFNREADVLIRANLRKQRRALFLRQILFARSGRFEEREVRLRISTGLEGSVPQADSGNLERLCNSRLWRQHMAADSPTVMGFPDTVAMDERFTVSLPDNGAGLSNVHRSGGFESFAVPSYMFGIGRVGWDHELERFAPAEVEEHEAAFAASLRETFGNRNINGNSRLKRKSQWNRQARHCGGAV